MRPDQVWRFIASDRELYKKYRELTDEQRKAYDEFVQESYRKDQAASGLLTSSWKPRISLKDWLTTWYQAQILVHVLCQDDFPVEVYENEAQAKEQALIRTRVSRVNPGNHSIWHVKSVRLIAEGRRG